tara:strand:+ start:69 stop:611 length:543 start_codon:yes stop_codon:yes gene_type:complete
MAFATIGNSALTGSIDLTSKVTGTLPTANGGTGSTSFSPGKINQIQYSQDADAAYIGTNSTSYVTTSQSVAITPSATNSKIQLNVFTGRPYTSGQSNAMVYNIYSSATSAYLGTGDNMAYIRSNASGGVIYSPFNIQFIDTTHNTTSAITYTVFMKSSSGWGYFAHEDSVWHIQATEILA